MFVIVNMQNIVHKGFIFMFIIYLHTKLHMSSLGVQLDVEL